MNVSPPKLSETTGGYYGIHATVSREKDGWGHTRHLPTFYLHANVQGILNEAGARRIAHDMIATILDLADDSQVAIHVHATHIGG